MELEIRAYGDIRDVFDEKAFTHEAPPGSTVGDVLAALRNGFDPLEELHQETLLVVKNGTNVTLLEGAATPLEDGDRLSLSSPPMPEG